MTGWEVVSPGKDGDKDEGEGQGEDGVGNDVEGEVDIEEEGAGVETGASSAAAKPFMPLLFTTAR